MNEKERRSQAPHRRRISRFQCAVCFVHRSPGGGLKDPRAEKVALTRIHQELTDNQTLIREIILRHQLVVRNLARASSNPKDSLWLQVQQDGYLDYKLLANGQSLYPRYPTSMSWEAAKSTGIIAELDNQTVEACTDVYTSQEIIVRGTLPKIVDDLFDTETPRMDKKLIKLRLEFEEMIAQGKTLLSRLQKALQQTK